MQRSLTESELIREIKNRSALGFKVLYDCNASLLYKIIWLSVKDKKLADYLLEEAILVICYRIDEFPNQELSFTLWMAGIAKGLALTEINETEHIQADHHKIEDPEIQFAF
jgi:hypothetical protein